MSDEADSQSLYLSVGLAEGIKHRLTVTAPGAGLRLAVGSLNSRSSVWRVTASRNDVYITAAGLGQSMKLSLHESGVWRQAYLSEEHAERAGAMGRPEFSNDPRVLDRWEAPEGSAGWMHALTVWVPHGHLTPLPDEVENGSKPIAWLPEPDVSEMVGLHFAVVRPDEGIFDTAGMVLVDGFRLPNKRALIAMTSRRPIEPARDRWQRDMAIAALAMMQVDHITHFGDPLRVGLFTRDDDGNRAVLDLRAPQRDELERVQREGLTVNVTYTPPHGDGNGSTPSATAQT